MRRRVVVAVLLSTVVQAAILCRGADVAAVFACLALDSAALTLFGTPRRLRRTVAGDD